VELNVAIPLGKSALLITLSKLAHVVLLLLLAVLNVGLLKDVVQLVLIIAIL